MPIFEPPVVNDLPAVPASCNHHHRNADPRHPHLPLACRARRFYGPNPRGRSVLRIGGVYQTIDTPTQDQIASATEVYMGGHVYEVDDDTANRLRAAGYTFGDQLLTEAGGILVTEDGRRLVPESAA